MFEIHRWLSILPKPPDKQKNFHYMLVSIPLYSTNDMRVPKKEDK